MTQDEKWLARYIEVVTFIETNKRRPSKYNPEERNAWNWLRHTQKQFNNGMLKEERKAKFRDLLSVAEQFRHVNQYV